MGIAAAACMMSVPVFADDLSPAQTKQIQGVVHDYLTQNPEVIVESLQSWQQKQMAQSVESTRSMAIQQADALFHQKSDPVLGNPNGKITVVEFFDYQCPHCVDMQQVFTDLVKNNPDVKLVLKEFPIRGPVSEVAAKAALAAAQQGKYQQLHDAIMAAASNGQLTEPMIYDLAGKSGLNVAALKKSVKSGPVEKQIRDNYQLAQALKLQGTPAIFIAASSVSTKSPDTAVVFIPGQTDVAHLNDAISQVSGQ